MEQNLLHRVQDIKNLDELKEESLFRSLSSFINEMLLHHFNELIQLLYRLDIDEQKLRTLLLENRSTDSGDLIARMILQRQEQKIKSRKMFKNNQAGTSEEEKW